jgi:signal transduction histidine kinase
MADPAPPVGPDPPEQIFDRERMAAFLETLERLAAGDVVARLPVTSRHDALDAIAYGINALVDELRWAGDRIREAQDQTAAALRAAVESAETRNSAILKAIPDMMFVLRRDGTYVDYHAGHPNRLFVAPDAFLGRTVHEILPAPLAERMMDALERASRSEEPVVVEYELPMGEPRFYEARIVQAGFDRLLTIVRDVTEGKRAADLNRDLARRLIASQEAERQRVARELHDDISQQLALLNIEIDHLAAQVTPADGRARLRKLAVQVEDIAAALHNLAYNLHPSRLQAVGVVAAIQSLCKDASQSHNLRVDFTHGAVPSRVNGHVALCLYRIVQEALHNIARHSRARDARIDLTFDEGHVALLIADTGVGFDPNDVKDAGLGLVSMQERVAALNGALTIDSVPGGGTRIAVRLPVAPRPADAPPFLAST